MFRKQGAMLLSGLVLVSILPATIAFASESDTTSALDQGGYVELTVNDNSPTAVMPTNGVAYKTAASKLTPHKWNSVDGGKWQFGVYATKVQSTYKHSKCNHTATAKNGDGNGPRVKAKAGNTAFSSVNATLMGNKAYYGFY